MSTEEESTAPDAPSPGPEGAPGDQPAISTWARRAATRPATAPMRISHAVLGPAVLRWLRCDVSGREHVPTTGGVILAANHRSFLDHFTLGAACPRPMRFLGKSQLAEGLAGRYNLAMGMIPVERGTADMAALELVIEALRAGSAVGIFPEGTRSPTGELFRFRSGMARVAAEAGVPIVPVGMTGMAEVWPRGRPAPRLRRPARGTLTIRFAPAVELPDDGPRSRRQATAAVHEAVAERCGQPLAKGFAPIPTYDD